MLIETSFKHEKTAKCINGIETLFMGIFALVLPYVYQIYNKNFINILKSAGVIIFGYYLIKICITFYRIKNEYYRDKDDFIKEDEDESEFEDDDDLEEDEN